MELFNRKVIIKPGVVLWGINERLVIDTNEIIQPLFEFYGSPCTITSAREGAHSSDESKHRQYRALDFRKWQLKVRQRKDFIGDLQAELSSDYFVLLEKTHIHVQLNR